MGHRHRRTSSGTRLPNAIGLGTAGTCGGSLSAAAWGEGLTDSRGDAGEEGLTQRQKGAKERTVGLEHLPGPRLAHYFFFLGGFAALRFA